MANTFKFGNGNWAVKDGYALAYNDENNNFKPLPFDFTRASSATTLNRQGLIETVPSGKPRIDFTDNTSGHLLLEPQRTNLQIRSEEFDNSAWGKSGSTVTANQVVSPDGSQTADKINDSGSGTGVVQVFDSVSSLSSGSTYTFSVFAKKGTIDYIALRSENFTTPNNSTSYFNISNGTLGTVDVDHTAKIVDFGNGWYRCSITFTISTDTSGSLVIRANEADNTPNVVRDGTKNVYLWGAQVEAGSYATSYIPTEGSSVTRVLDEADQTGVQQVIGQTEGTLYLEFVPLDSSALQILFQIRSSSGSVGQIDLRLQSGAIRTLGSDGGSTQFSFSGGSYTVGTAYKVAVRYKTNDTKLYINGSSSGSDTSCSFTSSTKAQISFSENVGSNFPALAEIKDARLYDTALTDTELQNLTS